MTPEDKRLEYFYDNHGYYSYVLVDCSDSLLQSIISKLRSNGFSVPRYGPSKRPASNGVQYQWYIRVFDTATGAKPVRERVDQFFENSFEVYSTTRRVLHLEAENRALVQTNQALMSTNHALHEDNKQLASKLAQLQERLDLSIRTEQERLELEQQVEEAEIYQGLYAEANEALVAENEELHRQLRNTENQISILQAQLEQQDNEQVVRASRLENYPVDGSEGAESLLDCLLPTINLVGPSKDVLFYEIENQRPILEALHRIEARPAELRGERVESTEEWREITKGVWRVYYRKIGPKFDVYIGRKAEQKQDIKYLQSL